ncbi:MAG TPA: calcium-binding protein [Nocardioidaceae bacterium]|nr:calcium-binding protein [Nocardioidaceae bacterium]
MYPLRVAASAALLLAVPPAASAAASASTPKCHGRSATIVGTSGSDKLVGTSGPDVIVGRGGNDTLRGHGGRDVICGNAGTDRILGGPGPDRLYGGKDGTKYFIDETTRYLGDTVYPGRGDDYVDLGYDPASRAPDHFSERTDLVSYVHMDHGVRVDLQTRRGYGIAHAMGTDRIRLVHGNVGVIGTKYDDTISGTRWHDYLLGGVGSDTISGGHGHDWIYTDHFSAGHDDDVVHGGTGRDLIQSRGGRDEISAGRGRDTVFASRGDTIHGGWGSDKIHARAGSRTHGGPGEDLVVESVTGGAKWVAHGDKGGDYLRLSVGAPFTTYSPGNFGTAPDQKVSVDLDSGRVTTEPATPVSTIRGFSSVTVGGRAQWYVYGTPGPDHVSMGSRSALHASTYGGDDDVRGGGGDDFIDAGAGDDTVDGRDGTDTCRNAEQTQNCELG